MGIFRSTDPTTWDDVDGIVVNESAPAPNVSGVAANIAILVGQAERGPVGILTEIGSIGEFFEQFGKSAFGMNLSLKNKRFGRLRVIRACASAAVPATLACLSSAAARITFTAKQGPGAYGNAIKVTIENGTVAGKKYTIADTSPNAVLPAEVYDNVAIASVVASTFAGSNLVTAVVNSTTAEPANQVATPLAGGTDGSIADVDYSAAIDVAKTENAGNFLFLDSYNATRNGYLKQHAADTQDKMVILAGLETDSVAQAITDVSNFRDVDGRLVYGFPWIQTSIDGVLTFTNPASWLASIMSQTAPHIDPAYVANAQFTGGMTALKRPLSRADYINLMNAGICAFEQDADVGFKPKSGVVTQISDSSKRTILRRRMADFLTNSVGSFLKNYQNAVNSKTNRMLVKGAILSFIKGLEDDGILPKDTEVTSGKAKLVDTESLNTDATIAAGLFKILWRQRIFSSMRFIVLQAEIGESVVVTDN